MRVRTLGLTENTFFFFLCSTLVSLSGLIEKKHLDETKKGKKYLRCLIKYIAFLNILRKKFLPLEELQCWPQFHWVVYVKTVVTAEQKADGGCEGSDVVVDNLLVNAQHEYVSSKAGGPWEKTTWIKNKIEEQGHHCQPLKQIQWLLHSTTF